MRKFREFQLHCAAAWLALDGRYTGWGPQIHQIHCVSARASDTLDTHLISKSLVTVRYTGYTGVSGPVSDTLDTHLPSRSTVGHLVSAHEGGRTEHAVLTRYHGRDCTQREHERVHEHKRTWLYPSDPNDASLRFLSTGGRWWIGGRMCQCQHICHGHAFAVLVVMRRCARRHAS